MKKLLTSVLSLFIVSFLFLSFSCKTNQFKTFEQIIERDDSNDFEIEIKRPLFANTEPDADFINSLIDERIIEQKIIFKEKVRDYVENGDSFKLSLIGNWKLSQYDESVFSCLLTFYAYTGGAHGYTVLAPINIDLKTGKKIEIENVNDSIAKVTKKSKKSLASILQTASKLSQEQISLQVKKKTKQDPKDILFMEGFQAKKENYALFTLTKKNIIFYFNEYQIAPYAFGYFHSEIPYEAFYKNFLNQSTCI